MHTKQDHDSVTHCMKYCFWLREMTGRNGRSPHLSLIFNNNKNNNKNSNHEGVIEIGSICSVALIGSIALGLICSSLFIIVLFHASFTTVRGTSLLLDRDLLLYHIKSPNLLLRYKPTNHSPPKKSRTCLLECQ